MHLQCLILIPIQINCELEVQIIIHLQNLTNQLPSAFIDTKKVIKSHISVTYALTRIDVPEGQLANESKIILKNERPCHAPIPSPTRLADPNRVRGARPNTVTIYLFFFL